MDTLVQRVSARYAASVDPTTVLGAVGTILGNDADSQEVNRTLDKMGFHVDMANASRHRLAYRVAARHLADLKKAWATAWSIYKEGKFSMDFKSPEALREYLKEHPHADKKKHHVVKDDGNRSPGTTHIKVKLDKDVGDEISKVWKNRPSGNVVDSVRKMVEDGKDVPMSFIDRAVNVLHSESNKPGLDKDLAKGLRSLRDKLKSKAK